MAAKAGVAQITLTWNANTESDFLRYPIYGGTAANPTTKMGSHTVVWNAEKVGMGVYFIRMQAGRDERMKKCVFVK